MQRRGWAGIKNGALLELASKEFDAFVTADQNLAYQQNLARLPISVFVLAARSTALADLAPLVPRLLDCLQSSEAGTLVRIEAWENAV